MVGWWEFSYGFRLQGCMLVESFPFAGCTNGQKDEDTAGHCKCLRGDFVQKTDHVTEDRWAELEQYGLIQFVSLTSDHLTYRWNFGSVRLRFFTIGTFQRIDDEYEVKKCSGVLHGLGNIESRFSYNEEIACEVEITNLHTWFLYYSNVRISKTTKIPLHCLTADPWSASRNISMVKKLAK